MRAGCWLGAALFGLAGLCITPEATAIVCGARPAYCISCGFALMRPLSGREISPNHVIDVVVSCYGESHETLPSLWIDGETLPSDWAPLGAPYYDGEEAHQRFRRRGPAFPAGARVTLGTLGDGACQLARRADCRGTYSTVCASNPQVDCCRRDADAPPTPLSAFVVSSGPVDVPGPSPDAGHELAPASEPIVDAGADSALDAAANHDAGAPDSGAVDASPSTPRVDTLPFEVRCTTEAGSTLLYLETGDIDDSIVEVELAWRSEGSFREWLTWYAEPCLGRSTRSFDATLPGLSSESVRPTLAMGESYSYEIRARTEVGQVADPETGTLHVPEDCVGEGQLGMTWQNSSFTASCDEFDPNHTASVPAELSMTVSPGSCLSESPDQETSSLEDPLLTTERPAPAPAVVSEPSPHVPSVASTSPVAEPSPSSGDCSVRPRGRPRGGFAWWLAGMVGSSAFVRSRRRTRA